MARVVRPAALALPKASLIRDRLCCGRAWPFNLVGTSGDCCLRLLRDMRREEPWSGKET